MPPYILKHDSGGFFIEGVNPVTGTPNQKVYVLEFTVTYSSGASYFALAASS